MRNAGTVGSAIARGFKETHLWSFQGPDTARRLYKSHDFEVAEGQRGDQWGHDVPEQRFVRTRPD